MNQSFTTADVLLAASLVLGLALLSFLLIAVILVGLPADHFHAPPRGRPRDRAAWVHVLAVAGRNVLGLALVVVGIILSIPGVPGQGFLTILTGLILMDFPGKRGLERRLFARPAVLGTVNRLRLRLGRKPLEPPEGFEN